MEITLEVAVSGSCLGQKHFFVDYAFDEIKGVGNVSKLSIELVRGLNIFQTEFIANENLQIFYLSRTSFIGKEKLMW
jgi:hypothetical protein